jgi:DNA polymerase-3 subunit epsilon
MPWVAGTFDLPELAGFAEAAVRARARWADGAVLGFDTETTGVDVETDRIVSAALVRREGATTTITSWLIDPGVDIPAGASAIHGITTAHAHAHGAPPAAALEEIAAQLAAALRRGEPVVAFNACFDLSILDAELRRHALPTLADRLDGGPRAVIDPLVLDRHLDRLRSGRRTLGDLCDHYQVTSTASLHTADVDVIATLDVLHAMTVRFPEVAGMSLPELYALQVTAHEVWAEGFNAWRTTQGLTGPGADAAWPVRLIEVTPA